LPGVRITVADTGSGIPLENRKHLFEPFYTTKKDVGTGLGLWITRGIVEKHGGMIHFRSKTRAGMSGTAFSLFLPLTISMKEGDAASWQSETSRLSSKGSAQQVAGS